MQLLDVNVLVYAFRRDVPGHERFASWLDELVNGERPFGVSDLVSSGFLRIVTHPRIFIVPAAIENALEFVETLRDSQVFVPVAPGPRHWEIFTGLCRNAGVRGNLVADAYLAAMAIELDCEWISTDRDFSRFPGLRWRLPF